MKLSSWFNSSKEVQETPDFQNFTSFNVADPIPTSSNVCNCKDINDVHIVASETVDILRALNDYFNSMGIQTLSLHSINEKSKVTFLIKVYGMNSAFSMEFSNNIVFEKIHCISCGTLIGWCTQISGRAFRSSPNEFISAMINDTVKEY